MSLPSTFQVYNASAGSGKTFTLVKEYLKIILKDPDPRLYQHILAITFTNKAAAEMKDRILENLLEFSTLKKEEPESDMMMVIMSETGLDRSLLQYRSKDRLQDILKNYASFHIKTIDSFTNKLIKSFAFDLGLSSDFEVELDTDSMLKESVDTVLSKIGIDKQLTKLLVSFSKQKTLEDKSWDVTKDLFEVSKLILNENHAAALHDLTKNELSSFSNLSKTLRDQQKSYIDTLEQIGSDSLNMIESEGLDHKDFQRSQLPKFFIKMIKQPLALDFDQEGSMSRNIEARNFYTKSKAQEIGSTIDGIADGLIGNYHKAGLIFEKLKLNELILKNLVPLAVINAINQALEEIKTSNNIRLNAEFNQMISEYLVNEPAAFIYEKLGERFKYFFIDEMQDTSVLQWQNLIPLIDNALSTEETGLMLVGDAKQAIYRWRGGRAEQFIELSSEETHYGANPFQTNKVARNLDTNFRSFSEIIQFNNDFFTHISQHFSHNPYADLYKTGNAQNINSKQGGYVNLQFLEPLKNVEERDEIYPEYVYNRIVKLLEQYDPRDICILVRKKKEGVAIAKYLTDRHMDIVSSETLLIKNNVKVSFIIALLQLFHDGNNDDARFEVLTFLYDHLNIQDSKHDFISGLISEPIDLIFNALEQYRIFYNVRRFNEYSIFEGIEDIIRSFGLTKESDAFLQFFMDFVFDFTQRKSQKTESFLAYWEEKKDKLNIVSSDDLQAVRIMTIHKSKGLEFPVVIFPYDLDLYYERDPKAWFSDLEEDHYGDFKSILVDSTSSIKKTGKHGIQIFQEQRKEKELDSFNLLYVCLTRAVEQLYVISELKKPKDGIATSAQLFMDFLKQQGLWQENQQQYSFGNPQRIKAREEQISQAEIQRDFISSSWNDHQIHIVANSELLWDKDRAEAIGYGNMILEMLSRIHTEEDIDHVVNSFVIKGNLRGSNAEEVRSVLFSIVQHSALKPFFKSGLIIINEREILTDSGQIVIPDRLVLNEGKMTVIDYKTGKPNSSHQLQIDNYAFVLEKLGYQVQEKILVYIDKDIKIIKS